MPTTRPDVASIAYDLTRRLRLVEELLTDLSKKLERPHAIIGLDTLAIAAALRDELNTIVGRMKSGTR